jgi:hypothetical protein
MPREGRSREATLVSGIIAALREIPGCVVRKRHGTAWGVAGDPDLYGSINGRHFEIEVKRRGEVPTPHPAGAPCRLVAERGACGRGPQCGRGRGRRPVSWALN